MTVPGMARAIKRACGVQDVQTGGRRRDTPPPPRPPYRPRWAKTSYHQRWVMMFSASDLSDAKPVPVEDRLQ
jgi:hypothetical protein